MKKKVNDLKAKIITEKKIKRLEERWDFVWIINLKCDTWRVWTDIVLCKREELTKKAVIFNDLLICKNLTNQHQIDLCIKNSKFEIDNSIFKQAISARDKTLCETLYDQSKVDFCKSYIN